MDCPRCGAELTEIAIVDEKSAVYCEECNFANIESEHTLPTDSAETWEEAFRRFYGTDGETPTSEAEETQT